MRVPIVVVGGAALAFDASVRASGDAALSLGEIGRKRAFAHLYPIATNEPAGAATFWRHVAHTSWLVVAPLTPREDGASWRLFEDLSRVLDAQRRDVVVTMCGDAELEKIWRAYGGPKPLAVGSDWRALLKPLLKDAFTRLRVGR